MDIVGAVALTVRITPDARKILEREANNIMYGEKGRLPLGRMITAMILWFEDNKEWVEIKDAVRDEWGREAQARRVRDHQRKRRNPAPRAARKI
jgi:hypothetical protein